MFIVRIEKDVPALFLKKGQYLFDTASAEARVTLLKLVTNLPHLQADEYCIVEMVEKVEKE